MLKCGVLIAVLIVVVFGVSLYGDFVFDDNEAIVNNVDLESNGVDLFAHDFWGKNITDVNSHKSYRPLTILAYRLIYRLSITKDPYYFHLANLISYLILCCCLHSTLRSLLVGPCFQFAPSVSAELSTTVTILFTVHPVHCESVLSCVGLADILSALFSLLALKVYLSNLKLTFLKITTLNVSQLFKISLIVSLVALSTFFKEQGVTFLAILILLNQFLLFKTYGLCRKWNLLGVILVCSTLVIFYIRMWIMNFVPPKFGQMDNPASHMDDWRFRAINYSYLYLLNCFLMICPIWLSFDWSMGCIPLIQSLFDYRLWLVLVFYLSLLVVFLRLCLHQPLRNTILFLMISIITFLPSSNIFFQVGFVIAERSLFIPVLGYLLFLTCAIQRCSIQFGKPKVFSTLLYTLILLYSIRSSIRTVDWLSEANLFERDVHVCPLNAKIYYNIAKVSADQGNAQKAIDNYKTSLKLYPNYTSALNNLANILKDRGQFAEAKALLEKACLLDPEFATALMNLAVVEMNLGHLDRSEKLFHKTVKLRPNHAKTHFNFGNLYRKANKIQEAEASYRKAVQLNPKLIQAWNNLVLILQNQNRLDEALELGKKSIQLNPDEHLLHFVLANIFAAKNQLDDAEIHFWRAAELKPDKAAYCNNLAVLYHKRKDYPKARLWYKRTLQLDSNHPSARKHLEKIKTL